MFLEKIEIQGFKSFAKRTTVQFAAANGRQHNLTVIVGPNGSGKSNIADAVRWVLGEQSSKTLRGKKSEDVIFAGSATKGRLGFAEVSLFLNNEDKKAPIEYTQLVITRRLYRDGESEYLINGAKVRLLDVTLLLARARFGQRAYSVVGQGMVDAFLNTNPAERKDFFDEATGVKMYQLKKHEAVLKFRNAEGNLEQVETLLAEIEPRLKSLTRQVKKLEQRAELERELRSLQTDYYAREWQALTAELTRINSTVVQLETEQRAVQQELHKHNQELTEKEKTQYHTAEREAVQREQRELQAQRNRLGQQLAEVRAQKSVALQIAGKTDVAWLTRKADEVRETLQQNQQSLDSEARQEAVNARATEVIRREQALLDERIAARRQEVMNARFEESEDAAAVLEKIRKAVDELFALNTDIHGRLEAGEDVRPLFERLHEKITGLQALAQHRQQQNEDEFNRLQQELGEWEQEKNAITQRYIEAQGGLVTSQQAVRRYRERAAELEGELQGIEKQLHAATAAPEAADADLDGRERTLAAQVEEIDGKIAAAERRLEEIQGAELQVREEIVALQKKAHQAQSRHTDIMQRLNAVLVEKARFETRREDLENEIRQETNALKEVMEHTASAATEEREEVRERIQKIKRQLELIGGIDPETQKEYEETKERYEFLHTQAVDLRKAITSLRKVIEELEKTIQKTFDTAFKEIAKQFEEYFRILFDGGTAKLEKIMAAPAAAGEAEGGEREVDEQVERELGVKKKEVLAGIDVMASPPNKKVKHISMLSGGERALTSIALIAAIIAVNPSPFVMLDEVDAALDEANSQRLAKILEDLSKKTQFIAITHNRTIMYKADVMYGVTMGDDGVSKLLSVKVEDVKAARR